MRFGAANLEPRRTEMYADAARPARLTETLATQQSVSSQRPATIRHAALVVLASSLLFGWLFLSPVIHGQFLSESDLYEYYLPIFLAPITTWSHFEFGGLPAFADPGDFVAYPPHFLFARIIGSWTGLSVSAFVLATCFTYAYVYRLTRSISGSAFAGLAYGLSEAMMERLPHSGALHAAAWLPLIVLSIEGLRAPSWRRWLAVGGIGAACCFLAGHPQPAIYIYVCALLYAATSGWIARADRAYYIRVASMFALGALLASIKALPFVEASFYMARQEVNFGQFVGHANSPAQMLSMLYPTILHEGREAPTYVGLVTLGFACIAVLRMRFLTWHVRFWLAISVFALLLGAGDSTPVANLVFHLPLYDKFRVGARHLILAGFGLSVLAGLAVAALSRREVPRRTIVSSGAVLLGALAAGAVVMAYAPSAFRFESRAPLPWTMPVWSGGVWVQFAIGLAAAAVLLASKYADRRAWTVTAAALLLADTLYSLPYPITATGLDRPTISREATRPSVQATHLASAVAPLKQRVLAPAGTHRDAVVPAAWARLWQIPIAGGYGPMLLQNYSTMARMGTNGSVLPYVLGSDDRSLDLLAVRRIVMHAEDLTSPPTFERDDLTWSSSVLNITVGRGECHHPYARNVSLPLPSDTELAEIAIVGHVRCGEDLPSGTEVVRVELRGGGSLLYRTSLALGKEIADRTLADPSVAARAKHGPAIVFDDPVNAPNEYLIRIRPPAPVRADQLVLHVNPISGWVVINRMTVVNGAGHSIPLSQFDLSLRDKDRWTEIERFDTSRTSDREGDERRDDETGVVVFENRRALPRAWIVETVLPLAREDLVEAIRHGQLPDGSAFEPERTALVDNETASPRHFSPGPAAVAVESIRDSHIVVNVSSNGGFLVLSETFYPGWRAKIAGRTAAVERVNLALQGVAVPAGTHRVEFEFVSRTQQLGLGLSAAGCIIALVLIRPR
jgi:hypothetical protein